MFSEGTFVAQQISYPYSISDHTLLSKSPQLLLSVQQVPAHW